LNLNINGQELRKFPKISIITPTFNGEKTIEACLQSVINQTYENKEHWIIDGVSTDKTVEIVQKWVKKFPHIHYISQKDSGVYQAMNTGIDLSKGEWLYFMGCDDTLHDENVLEKVSTRFDDSTQLLLGSIEVASINKSFIRHAIISWRRYWYCSMPHQGSFYNRQLFKHYRYDETLQISSDYKLNLLLIENKVTYKVIDVIICKYSTTGKSAQLSVISFWEGQKMRRAVLPLYIALFFNFICWVGFYGMMLLKKILPNGFIHLLQKFKQRYLIK
jgi:glycosyltransferase involved in cell wall biosynthesis